MGAFFPSESRGSFTIRAAFRCGLRLRLRHNASPVPGPVGTSFAVFWNTCQWFGGCFLFFYPFAQCATGLIPLFLLGITAFGVFAVPLFLVFRGITVGIGVSYFLWKDELFGLLQCALIYTPAAAATGVLLLLFAVRSFQFSGHLAKASFSSQQGGLDLKLYFYDFLLFCSFSVGISLLGSLLASVYFLFV